MKMQEFEIVQKPSEPPRRYFTDNAHSDLFVWYPDSRFLSPSGFQLGFREVPNNTDNEIVWTQKSKDLHPSARLGLISPSEPNHPAPKVIHPSTKNIPKIFWEIWSKASTELPTEIRKYIETHLEGFKKS